MIAKALESFLCCYKISGIKLYGVENPVVCYTALYQIILSPEFFSFPVSHYKIKPFSSILVEV